MFFFSRLHSLQQDSPSRTSRLFAKLIVVKIILISNRRLVLILLQKWSIHPTVTPRKWPEYWDDSNPLPKRLAPAIRSRKRNIWHWVNQGLFGALWYHSIYTHKTPPLWHFSKKFIRFGSGILPFVIFSRCKILCIKWSGCKRLTDNLHKKVILHFQNCKKKNIQCNNFHKNYPT